jgi:hypothetical protein
MPDWMRSSGTQVLLIAILVLAVLFGFQFYQNQKRLEVQKQIELLNVRVAFGQDERRVSTGVFGTVFNNSEQIIRLLEITTDYLDEENEVVKSARFFPVYHLSFQNPGALEPQQSRQFGFDLEPQAPPNWSGEVRTRVSEVQFR